jgi:hypothetical protein
MNSVYSFWQAIEAGHQPREFPFDKTIPAGTFDAIMEFKIWGKKTMGIVCYFTMRDTNRKFNLTVFRQENKDYAIKECALNFRECPTPALYRITIKKNKMDNPFFTDAVQM